MTTRLSCFPGALDTQRASVHSLGPGYKEASHGSKAAITDEFLLHFHTTLKYYTFREIIFMKYFLLNNMT